jgi:hypothetical protein
MTNKELAQARMIQTVANNSSTSSWRPGRMLYRNWVFAAREFIVVFTLVLFILEALLRLASVGETLPVNYDSHMGWSMIPTTSFVTTEEGHGDGVINSMAMRDPA